MRGWIIQPDQPVEVAFLARTVQNEAGGGAPALADQWGSRILTWTFNSAGENRQQNEHIRDMINYHRGFRKFWFDAGMDGNVKHRKFLGFGDGTRTDFYLPSRFVFAPSVVMTVNNAIVTAWTCVESTGMIRFTSAPAAGAHVCVEKYKCRVKAFFVVNDDKVYSGRDNFKSFESNQIVIREFPY